MSGLTLYIDNMSPQSRAVYLFMKINRLPFNTKVVVQSKGEHLQREFSSVSNLPEVPVLDDNGFILRGSLVIMKYLCEKYEKLIASHWYPKDFEMRARVDEYCEWQHLTIRLLGGTVLQSKLPYPEHLQKAIFSIFDENGEPILYGVTEQIQEVFLKSKPYIAGDEPTIADLLCLCELTQLCLVGLNDDKIMSTWPLIGAWMEKMKVRLKPHFEDIHKTLFHCQ